MRIAVSADDARGLDAAVSPHFGRCPYYVLVDVDEGQISSTRVVANPFYGQHRPGQVPAFIQSQGANVMLTGGMGARAMSFFEQCGIEAVTGATGSVRHALQAYLDGRLQGSAPCGDGVAHGHGCREAHGPDEQDELGRLREEAESLQRGLDEVMRRLGGLPHQ